DRRSPEERGCVKLAQVQGVPAQAAFPAGDTLSQYEMCQSERRRTDAWACSPHPTAAGPPMKIAFDPDETFRDNFRYRNSPHAIPRFPFPFAEDTFQYSVNIEPHTAGPRGSCFEFPVDIDEHYVAECRERALCLATTSHRYLSLPHMMSAQWDVLELVMT